MEPEILITRSALKHDHLTKADIRQAVRTKIFDARVNEFDNKYALIGFDTKTLPVEILYGAVDDVSRRMAAVNPSSLSSPKG
jgi:hypothetical protein